MGAWLAKCVVDDHPIGSGLSKLCFEFLALNEDAPSLNDLSSALQTLGEYDKVLADSWRALIANPAQIDAMGLFFDDFDDSLCGGFRAPAHHDPAEGHEANEGGRMPVCFCGTDRHLSTNVLPFEGGWVQCSRCGLWCHCECAGLDAELAASVERYLCYPCEAATCPLLSVTLRYTGPDGKVVKGHLGSSNRLQGSIAGGSKAARIHPDDTVTAPSGPVTAANVEAAVLAGCRRRLFGVRRNSFVAMRRGFLGAEDLQIQLSAFGVDDLCTMLQGKAALSKADLLDCFVLPTANAAELATSGFAEAEASSHIFFSELLRADELSEQERLSLFRWCTALGALPVGGLRNEDKIRLRLYGPEIDDDTLPETHTCTRELHLPNYSSMNVLRDKLMYALAHSGDGFYKA